MHLISKGKRGDTLEKSELTQLIRAACDFLIDQHGRDPQLEFRKSLVQEMHDLFPHFDANDLLKKLSQRIRNGRRLKQKNTPHGATKNDSNLEDDEYSNIEFLVLDDGYNDDDTGKLEYEC